MINRLGRLGLLLIIAVCFLSSPQSILAQGGEIVTCSFEGEVIESTETTTTPKSYQLKIKLDSIKTNGDCAKFEDQQELDGSWSPPNPESGFGELYREPLADEEIQKILAIGTSLTGKVEANDLILSELAVVESATGAGTQVRKNVALKDLAFLIPLIAIAGALFGLRFLPSGK